MLTSPSIKNISEAIIGFHKAIGVIYKDTENPFFKKKYADLATIQKAIHKPLQENGLAILQFPEGDHGLTTRLLHVSGEWMEGTYYMNPVKNSPQEAGSVITYQRRYAIGAILNLNIDEDDDANKASQGETDAKTNGTTVKAPEKPWLNESTEQFKQALTYLNRGGLITDIEKKYRISKAVREKLLSEVTIPTPPNPAQ
jgi:hypothetical protein